MTDPTMIDDEKRRSAVLALSVYNVLSLSRTDLLVSQVVEGLRHLWEPPWAPVEEVVTTTSVLEAAARLAPHVEVDGMHLRIPIRGGNGRGRDLRMNLDRTAVVG